MLSLLLTVEAGSSPGYIISLKSDLGQVTYPLWALLQKEASINDSRHDRDSIGECDGSTENSPWLCGFLMGVQPMAVWLPCGLMLLAECSPWLCGFLVGSCFLRSFEDHCSRK